MTWPAEPVVFRAIPGDLIGAVAFKPTLLLVYAPDLLHARVTIHVLAEIFARRFA